MASPLPSKDAADLRRDFAKVYEIQKQDNARKKIALTADHLERKKDINGNYIEDKNDYILRLLELSGESNPGESMIDKFIKLLVNNEDYFKVVSSQLPSLKMQTMYGIKLIPSILSKGTINQINILFNKITQNGELESEKKRALQILSQRVSDPNLSTSEVENLEKLISTLRGESEGPLNVECFLAARQGDIDDLKNLLRYTVSKGETPPILEVMLGISHGLDEEKLSSLLKSHLSSSELLKVLTMDKIHALNPTYPFILNSESQNPYLHAQIEQSESLLAYRDKEGSGTSLLPENVLSDLVQEFRTEGVDRHVESWMSRKLAEMVEQSADVSLRTPKDPVINKSVLTLTNQLGEVERFEISRYSGKTKPRLQRLNHVSPKVVEIYEANGMFLTKPVLSKLMNTSSHEVLYASSDPYAQKISVLASLSKQLAEINKSQKVNSQYITRGKNPLVAKHPENTKELRTQAKKVLSNYLEEMFLKRATFPILTQSPPIQTHFTLKNSEGVAVRYLLADFRDSAYIIKEDFGHLGVLQIQQDEIDFLNITTLTNILKGDKVEPEFIEILSTKKDESFWDNWQQQYHANYMDEYRNVFYPLMTSTVLDIMTKIKHPESNNPINIMEVCGGTGDIAQSILNRSEQKPEYYLFEYNEASLETAEARLEGRAHCVRTDVVDDAVFYADKEKLTPLTPASMDIAFGSGALTQAVLENKEAAMKALKHMHHYLRPGGILALAGHGHSLVNKEDIESLGFKVVNTSIPGYPREFYIAQKL